MDKTQDYLFPYSRFIYNVVRLVSLLKVHIHCVHTSNNDVYHVHLPVYGDTTQVHVFVHVKVVNWYHKSTYKCDKGSDHNNSIVTTQLVTITWFLCLQDILVSI